MPAPLMPLRITMPPGADFHATTFYTCYQVDTIAGWQAARLHAGHSFSFIYGRCSGRLWPFYSCRSIRAARCRRQVVPMFDISPIYSIRWAFLAFLGRAYAQRSMCRHGYGAPQTLATYASAAADSAAHAIAPVAAKYMRLRHIMPAASPHALDDDTSMTPGRFI